MTKPKYKGAQLYKVALVRESKLAYETEEESCLMEKCDSPSKASTILAPLFENADREMFVVMMLDIKNHVIGVNVASVGTLSTSVVHPREVFKPAILTNAHCIVVAHNHPSGNTAPSYDDIETTKRIKDAGNIIGIKLLDHIILGHEAPVTSMREKGYLD